jgi:flavin-dependent dehydrogenase
MWRVRLAGGERLAAPLLVLASGKHELRGHGRATAGRAIGLKLHVRLTIDLAGTVLLPAGHGYAGLQPSGHGLANVCLAIKGSPPRDAAAMIALVAGASDLGARLLAGAEPAWPRPLAVAGVPYGFLHRDGPAAPPCLYRIGDQFAVVPSFCGEGMGMALAGGRFVAEAIGSGTPAAAFHLAWRRELAAPMRWAGMVGWLLDAAPGLLTRAAGLPGAGRLIAARTRVGR